MDNRAARLLRILREEVELYRRLVDHARRKSAALVSGRLDDVLESNKVDETFGLQLRILGNEVELAVREICAATGVPRERFTLGGFAASAAPAAAAEIEAQKAQLGGLIAELKALDARNAKLADSSLRYARAMADFVGNLTGSYRGSGLLGPLNATPRTISRHA